METLKKVIVNAKPKVKGVTFLLFGSMNDLSELIRFTGRTPMINEDLSLQIKKHKIVAPCYISKEPETGNINEVLSGKEFTEKYDTVNIQEMTKEFYEPVLNGKKEKVKIVKK